MSFPNKLLSDQEELVVRLHDAEKLPYREIGVRLGVTHSRAWQIHIAASAKLRDFAENGANTLSHLPARVRRVIVDCQLCSRALARAAIESGELAWNEGIGSIRWHGTMLPKVSRRTWAALYEWTGRPNLPPQPKIIRGYPANGLSSRANDCLSRAHIPATKSAVHMALTTGVLSLCKSPLGYGKVTHTELCRWAGVTPRAANPD